MLSVDEALEMVLAGIERLTIESIPIQEARGRVLAGDVTSAQDLPPFDNSAMDGYAVIAANIQQPPVTLTIVEDIPAGKAPQKTLQSGQAARIMTGAPLPPGADSIVPVELTGVDRHSDIAPDVVEIFQAVERGAYVRPVGEDIQQGEIVLSAGHLLRPADIGVLAGLGYSSVEVVRRPRVGILSTGDELLLPDQPLTPGKIRDMNTFTITALVEEYGGEPVPLGIARDTEQSVRDHLNRAIEESCDLILSSAGVSVGAFDVVKTVLEEMGAVNFWKVNMRPGKPLTHGYVNGIPFLGLPGNPVSSMVSFEVFARPVIRKMLGLDWGMQTRTVRVGETLRSDGRMTFARVKLVEEAGDLVAYTTGTQSSGAISSMVKADGLLIIPAGVTEIKPGDRLAVRPFFFDA
ncbi:MAG: molybdopterin molybdotransferase MoeA [Chloroflexi bacterium]|nr:molybdopterin molybdotransferase MoeA [Chloroflexota bacterium]